ncbi:MAG: D-Ala-D-Ala carboxypeptidase family metallohydrolase [Cyanobacteria bacterium J06598_3]
MIAPKEPKNTPLIERIEEYRDPAYRRWRVLSTFATGFLIGLFYVLLISEKVLADVLNDSGQRSLVLIFSGIFGGVIYTILVDGHVEMPRFIEDGNKFEAGLFGDILLGIAGAIVLDYIAEETFGMSFPEPIELAAVGLVGGYGGRAILQFALNRVFKDVNLRQADREKYLQDAYQSRLGGLQLIEGLNRQVKAGLPPAEWADLSQAIQQASASVKKQVFELAKDFRRTATLAGETNRIERTIPVFQTLIDSEPGEYRYYGQLAYAYRDSAEPDFFKAIQHLDKAIDLRGDEHRAQTWKYELSRAIAHIQNSYNTLASYEFDSVTNQRIIDDLLAVAEIYNLENILKAAEAKNIPVPIMEWMQHNQAMLASDPGASVLIGQLDAMITPEFAVDNRVRSVSDSRLPKGHSLAAKSRSANVTSPLHRVVTPGTQRWQQAIQQAKAAGASAVTAGQDGLKFSGVKASYQMAQNDWPRVEPLMDRFCRAGEKFELPPELLAAIASRESRCGNTSLLVNGWGDHGNAFGIMQVDKRYHQIAGVGSDSASLAHIEQATGILADYLQQVRASHPTWKDGFLLEGAAVAYNSGVQNVRTQSRMNEGTTGNDYGADVIARAQFYASRFSSSVPESLVPESSIPSEDGRARPEAEGDWMEAVRETWLKRSPDPVDSLSSAYKKRCVAGTRYGVASYQKDQGDHYLVTLAQGAGDWYIFDSKEEDYWDTTWENDHGEAGESGSKAVEARLDLTKMEVKDKQPVGDQLTPDMPFDTLITPHVTYGELAKYQEARRFVEAHQCKTAYELCLFLEKCREHFGDKPLVITSGYRPPQINWEQGGATTSEHLYDAPSKGAVDFYIPAVSEYELQNWCLGNYPFSVGKGAYRGFVHLGIRPDRRQRAWPY